LFYSYHEIVTAHSSLVVTFTELLPPAAATLGTDVGVTDNTALAFVLVYLLLKFYSLYVAVSVRAAPTSHPTSIYALADALTVKVTVTVYSTSVPAVVVNFTPVVPATPLLKATGVPFTLIVKLSTTAYSAKPLIGLLTLSITVKKYI
jgi:hypothetical protein